MLDSNSCIMNKTFIRDITISDMQIKVFKNTDPIIIGFVFKFE